MISPEYIKAINEAIEAESICNDSLLESALSSWSYYDDIKDRVSSIVRGIIKNHSFKDGNKRTAVIILYKLSKDYNLKLIADEDLEEIIVQIADSKYDITYISSLIFKK